MLDLFVFDRGRIGAYGCVPVFVSVKHMSHVQEHSQNEYYLPRRIIREVHCALINLSFKKMHRHDALVAIFDYSKQISSHLSLEDI